MSKIVSMCQILDIVDTVKDNTNRYVETVVCVVKYSNFLKKETKYSFCPSPELTNLLKSGDRIKVSHFAENDDIERIRGGVSYKALGGKYEKWNPELGKWTLLLEK